MSSIPRMNRFGLPSDPVVLAPIRRALDANPGCRIDKLLARERVVMAERGPLSFAGGRELLALVAEDSGYWYGHVLRLDPSRLVEPDGREWVALLVCAGAEIDGATPGEVLERARYLLTERLEYEPCYAQEPEDTFAREPTFEAACAALAHMIGRFDLALRVSLECDKRGLAIRPGHLDLRCMDIYGLSCDTFREEEEAREVGE